MLEARPPHQREVADAAFRTVRRTCARTARASRVLRAHSSRRADRAAPFVAWHGAPRECSGNIAMRLLHRTVTATRARPRRGQRASPRARPLRGRSLSGLPRAARGLSASGVSLLSWSERTANNRKVRGSSPRGTMRIGFASPRVVWRHWRGSVATTYEPCAKSALARICSAFYSAPRLACAQGLCVAHRHCGRAGAYIRGDKMPRSCAVPRRPLPRALHINPPPRKLLI